MQMLLKEPPNLPFFAPSNLPFLRQPVSVPINLGQALGDDLHLTRLESPPAPPFFPVMRLVLD